MTFCPSKLRAVNLLDCFLRVLAVHYASSKDEIVCASFERLDRVSTLRTAARRQYLHTSSEKGSGGGDFLGPRRSHYHAVSFPPLGSFKKDLVQCASVFKL